MGDFALALVYLAPFAVGLAIGRWWAIPLAAGGFFVLLFGGLELLAYNRGNYAGYSSDTPDPVALALVIIVPVFVVVPALAAAVGVAIRRPIAMTWAMTRPSLMRLWTTARQVR